MWWEKKSRPAAPPIVTPVETPRTIPESENSMNEPTSKTPTVAAPSSQQTLLGRTVAIQGQITADEDLLVEGQFDGTVNLESHCMTVGANGQVKAEIHARQVVVMGSVTGNITAREKIEIRRTGHVVGDLRAVTVAIEEGAYFKGSIDILRDEGREAFPGAPSSNALKSSVEDA